MKNILFGLALVLAGTTGSFAANAWKEADAGGHKIYTDAHGMTLYTYDKDVKGVSDCNDTCASTWRPLKASPLPKARATGPSSSARTAAICGRMAASRFIRMQRTRRPAT